MGSRYFRASEALFCRQVADHDQRAVVGRVVRLEELLQILPLPALDVGRPADRRDLVGVRDERRRLHLLDEKALVVVLDGETALGVHDAALALDHLGIEREVGEAIRLEVEDEIERGTRHPVLVDGHVLGRVGIVGAALRFHELVELARRAPARAVEHHVLEEMRETGDARHLVAAADPHPVVERHVRDVAIRPDDDAHAIGERGRLHLFDARNPGGGRGRAGLGRSGSRDRGTREDQRAERAGREDFLHARTLHAQKKSAACGGSRKRRQEANTGEELFAVLCEDPSVGGVTSKLGWRGSPRAVLAPVARRWARNSRGHHDVA
jgi:hypothetical protein